jgi:hypothetical protein
MLNLSKRAIESMKVTKYETVKIENAIWSPGQTASKKISSRRVAVWSPSKK